MNIGKGFGVKLDKNKEMDSIFKDSTEDITFNEDYKKKNPYEKEMRRLKIISISILGVVLAIIYLIIFFTKVYPIINDQYAKVKEEKDSITYTLKRASYTEIIEVKGRPNQSQEAFISATFKSGKEKNYLITFSNPNDWGNSYISMYNQNNSLIYEEQYENSHVRFNYQNFMEGDYSRIIYYESNHILTMEDLEHNELVGLALRNNVRFRGNVISLFLIFILFAVLVYSIFFWEKSFERWMRWNTNYNSNIGPSDFYEFRVRIGQILIIILIFIELFRAFTY